MPQVQVGKRPTSQILLSVCGAIGGPLDCALRSTLEMIQLAVEHGATAQLMLLHTARPEFGIQWPRPAHHTQITLNRLSLHNVREVVGHVAAQKALSEENIDAVVERASGVPLFVEELTRAVLESSGASLSRQEIPVSLHDSLMARLDRLGPAKEILQIGAVRSTTKSGPGDQETRAARFKFAGCRGRQVSGVR
jgi:hypothetical protein